MFKLKPSLMAALPFWMSLILVPLVALSAIYGGLFLLLVPLFSFSLITLLDAVISNEHDGMDPETEEEKLFWYKLVTIIWAPIQIALMIGVVIAATWYDHLSTVETIALALVLGIVTGTIGINYAHELVHQKGKLERGLGELLLISTAYGHFKTEHVFIHHRHVATPRDNVTGRYNENFYRFLWRCVPSQFLSALKFENERLESKGRSRYSLTNPYWRYVFGALAFAIGGYLLGGWVGVLIWIGQVYIAVLYLELVNYVEHYGLTREYLGDGKYEHVKPRHSWNSDHRFTNFLLINLQRHSDHHYKPQRRFPVLQTYSGQEAPQLPHGYPLMGLWALVPSIWQSRMNPKVDRWRQRHYPDITDWEPYNKGTTSVSS